MVGENVNQYHDIDENVNVGVNEYYDVIKDHDIDVDKYKKINANLSTILLFLSLILSDQ